MVQQEFKIILKLNTDCELWGGFAVCCEFWKWNGPPLKK